MRAMRNRFSLPLLLAVACGHAAAPSIAPPPRAPLPVVSTPPGGSAAGPPEARTVDVVETLFDVKVADPYRWMEGNDNSELTTWLRAQGAYTEAYLGRLRGRQALFARVRELGLSQSGAFAMQLAGGRAFYQRVAAGVQLPRLVVREPDGKERVLVDPATLGTGGGHASVNAFAPSPDGARIAYDLALGGGEISTIHVMDVATGVELPDVIDRVWGEFSASWLPDGKSYFYTQMAAPAAGVDPLLGMQTRLHVLGTPVDQDVAILGRGVTGSMAIAPAEFPGVWISPDSTWMLAIAGGAHSELRIAVAPLAKLDRKGGGKTPWTMVAEYADQVEAPVTHGERLYLRTFKGASNRKLVSVPLAHPSLAIAKLELAEAADATIVRIAGARDALYVETMVDGRARMTRLPWNGKTAPVALPFDGWIDGLASDPRRDGVRIDLVGWTRPAAFFDYDRGAFAPTGIEDTSSADYANVVAEEVDATSSDGTQVPLSILHRKDLTADGSHPALVRGYGGYGVSQTPSFEASRLAWLERGGVYAVCHVRGGGEKGHRWQDDGTHEHKMNGVHDFEACGQYLIDHKLTSPAHLFGTGGSMGGILIGRAITDRPDLYAAVNIAVGMVNPLRILASENGENQVSELGDPRTADGFKSILEMDPYQHVAPATAYPAVIFTVGLNDKRVAPSSTGKMAAKLQVASTSGKPVLVRIDADTGHGVGSTRGQVYAERADVFAFFLAVSGDPDFTSP
jgi:prolyl oligopeptidase